MRCLDEVTRLVPFLQCRQGDAEPGDLLSRELIEDPDLLAAEITATSLGRGSDDRQVLASLWWQGYTYRTAGMTLAAWVAAGAAPDLAASTGCGVGVTRSRPSSLVVGATAAELADLSAVVDRLFAGHLDPLAESLRARHQIGARLVWGNAAASIASCLGALVSAEGAPPGLATRAEVATTALPHDIARLGSWTPPDRSYKRTTCCLWWKTTAAAGAYCKDCSLR